MKFPVTFRLYETIAFLTGFVLMAYELVASRILAPTIGSSTYVWTSVIGVIIAALSLGYAAGGWLADKRVAKQDIAALLLISAGTVTTTLLTSATILEVIGQMTVDSRLQGLLASLLLFMPTSFILGMISPYLVRLNNQSVATTGRAMASLSALNSLGGISGTFLAGFVFFSYIGSRETLVLIIALLVASSWLVMPRWQLRLRLLIVTALALMSILSLAPHATAGTIAAIDTPSSHYTINEGLYQGVPVRVLSMGPSGYQSGIPLDGSEKLVFSYTERMAALVDKAPAKQRILILGGGAFTLPQYFGKTYPNTHIDVVEIDPGLTSIAKRYFNYREPANVRIINTDARAFLEQHQGSYDLILVDAYSDLSVPFALATQEYTHLLAQRLSTNGTIIANIVGADTPACAPLLGAIHRSYTSTFPHYLAFPLEDSTLTNRQNIIVTYSKHNLSWAQDKRWLTARLPLGQLLTDNFAPVEHLHQRCWQ